MNRELNWNVAKALAESLKNEIRFSSFRSIDRNLPNDSTFRINDAGSTKIAIYFYASEFSNCRRDYPDIVSERNFLDGFNGDGRRVRTYTNDSNAGRSILYDIIFLA